MKKRVALFMCILLLAACTPQQSASREAAASAENSSESSEVPAQNEESSSQAEIPAAPSSSSLPEPQEEAVAEEPVSNGIQSRVNAVLAVDYGEEDPRFSQELAVPADASFSGDANTVTVERQSPGGWEAIRDKDTGNFTLEGKLTVKGPLPDRVMEEAGTGISYRITTVLHTGDGGTVTAANEFLAGETFASNAVEKSIADGRNMSLSTDVDMSGEGLLRFTQTITNLSGQTVSLNRSYQVLRQSGGGVWKEAYYPDGDSSDVSLEPVKLLPGASFTDEGILPVTAAEARKGGNYRIVRRATALPAGNNREFEFYTDMRAGDHFTEAAPQQETEAPVLRGIELSLGQTSFEAGEVPLQAFLKNMSEEPIVAGNLRVYNVKDGENLLSEETYALRVDVPAGGLPVLEETLTLEPGEYTVEMSAWVRGGGTQATLSKNFTVEAQGLKNPASGTTVEMKVSVEGQTENGLATFTQTFHNNSCQTLLAGREFRVERQAGGLWAKADYPAGSERQFQEDMVLLRPGESATFEGVLPFMAREMPDAYRISRTLQVENPLSSQQNGLTLVYTVAKK